MLIIKVTPEEHSLSCGGGCAYGLVNGIDGMYTYVEFGDEDLDSFSNRKLDPREDRRRFKNCRAYFAKTKENFEKENFEKEYHQGLVEIYK